MIGPFFSYYGGKHRMARTLYEPPEFDTIIEPFAGGAGYSCQYPDRNVVLYDKNEKLVGAWQYLIATSSEEILRLPLLAEGESVDGLHVCQEAKWLIGWWLNCAVSSPCKTLSKWGIGHVTSSPLTTWTWQLRQRIARDVAAIRHWRAHLASYETAPDVESTWFVDPPYEWAGKHYPHGSKAIDFDSLGAWCQERSGQVIVCENAGATWLPFRHLAHAQARFGKSAEVVWTNTEPRQASLLTGACESGTSADPRQAPRSQRTTAR